MITLQHHALSFLSHSSPSFASLIHPANHGLYQSTSLQALPNPLFDSVPAVMTLAMRGGAAAKAVALDLAKEKHHLEVLSSYGVLTVLILNSALRLYTSTKFKRDKTRKNDWVICCLFSIFAGTCVITGSFTGIMFQLLGIYSKSALAMGNDAGYLAFKEATLVFRRLGFHTFLTCLCSFVATFLISFKNMIREDERVGDGIWTAMAGLTVLGGVVMQKVFHLATVHIFSP